MLTWPGRTGAAIDDPADLFAPVWQRLRAAIVAEAGPGRLMPWLPVGFGAGIALYFSAAQEPMASVCAALAGALLVTSFLLRRSRALLPLALGTAAACGFCCAALKTQRIVHGVLARPVYAASIKGFVETHEVRDRTDRFVLRVTTIETSRDVPQLLRVRLSVKKGTGPAVGSFVELKARLLPPLQPLRPGSYDFARDMFFQGIGASGFAMGEIKVREPPADGGVALRYAAAMQGLRDAIDARIRTAISGDARAIATALLTGRRDAISAPVNDAMFISGLGHVLSISGYHMAVVAGLVFFAVRALLALIPALTVAAPIKKWAAVAALVAAAFYLLLSGAEVATQRSFVMTAVVLIAILVDRRAVTFRTLAIAAMAVLLITPEAIVHPSFQMSFAATLGLVALVSAGMPRLFATADHSATARVALWGGRELVMLTLASLVAGFATMPYAAFHFHRVTPYGVLANLAAMPVISALVMPAGILGLLAMPFGLDGPLWRLMAFGIGWMVSVSQAVAALPGAIGRVPAFGTGPLILASLGLILLGLLHTRLRWSGAALLVFAAGWAASPSRPDILVASDGANVAVRGADGRLRVLRAAKDSFQIREWLAGDADPREASDISLQDGVSCDAQGCVAALPGGALVALAKSPAALADDCTQAAVIVSAFPPPPDCPALVIAPDELRAQGALALRREGSDFVRQTGGQSDSRPWSPARGAVVGPRQRSPAVDATPAEADRQTDD